jgi:hypothetical protein
MFGHVDWSLLDSRGYVVLPNFVGIEHALLPTIERNWRNKNSGCNVSSSLGGVASTAPDSLAVIDLKRRFASVVRSIATSPRTRAEPDPDTLFHFEWPYARGESLYFSHGTSRCPGYAASLGYGLHVDRTSWTTTGDALSYFNFYLPIVKPHRNESNLQVLPFDSIKSATRQQLENQGNTLFCCGGDSIA